MIASLETANRTGNRIMIEGLVWDLVDEFIEKSPELVTRSVCGSTTPCAHVDTNHTQYSPSHARALSYHHTHPHPNRPPHPPQIGAEH
jgi:hypothetical protein